MAIIDEKGKLFGRVNIIDFCIVFVLVIVIIGGIFIINMLSNSQIRDTNQAVRYDVEFRYKPKEFGESIQIGGEVRSSIDGSYLGKLVNKKIVPSANIIPNAEEGKYVKAELPEEYDVIITIEANAVITDQEILAEGKDIKIGKQMFIKGKGYASPGFIVGIDYEE